MKKNSIRSLCAALGFATLVAICAMAFSSGIFAAEPAGKSPADIDKVIVDCRSAEAFAKTSVVYEHIPTASEPDPLTGGKYSFSPTMKAMQVEYHGGARRPEWRYRIMPHFINKDIVSTDYKYFVIVYAAKTNEPYSLTVWNGGGKGEKVVIAENGSDTRGKFVISEPFNIHLPGTDGQSTLTRWSSTVHSTIYFETASQDAKFFIKEYAFFKSAEDAKAYYNAVNINENPPYENTKISNDPWCEPGEGLIRFSYNKVNEPKASSTKVTIPVITDEEPKADPVIMSFEGKAAFEKNAKFAVLPDQQIMVGDFEFVTLDDGTQCLKLNHNYYKDWINDYRMMPIFNPGIVTKDHKYIRVVYMTTDPNVHQITLYNNKGGWTTKLNQNTAYSDGKFVATNPVELDPYDVERWMNGIHLTIGFNSKQNGSQIYIKEIGLFTTVKQAYEYYGDEPYSDTPPINYTAMTFGTEGNSEIYRDNASLGTSHDTKDTFVITQGTKMRAGSVPNVEYMANVRTINTNVISKNDKFIRVLYSAKHPEGIEKASMAIVAYSDDSKVLVSGNIVNTDGKFVLTEPCYLNTTISNRFNNRTNNALFINSTGEGGEYAIKAIYFFNTREDAENFTLPYEGPRTLAINGNDISKYQIVVSKDAPINVACGANDMAVAIKALTGLDVPVVTDDKPASEYEILVGESTRPLSTARYDAIKAKNEFNYQVYVDGNTLVIAAPIGISTPSAIKAANESLFYLGKNNAPEHVEIRASVNISAQAPSFRYSEAWLAGDPVPNPETVKVDFDTDEGYYNEDNGEHNFEYENGKYTVNANNFASSYMHLYEKNVNYKATLTYTSENDGSMGIMFRVNDVKAYCKAGYDFAKNEWYIESRDGADYYIRRMASAPAKITAGTPYEVLVEVLGKSVTLKINGVAVIENADPGHYSPGRLGLYAENANVAFDNVEAVLVSGQGTVVKNVFHTKLPDELYREGGSVVEKLDGTLVYVPMPTYKNSTFMSTDDGYTWTRTEDFAAITDYPSIVRLENGNLINIMRDTSVSKVKAYTSADDGKTWTETGTVCDLYYPGSSAFAGNMNDKLTVTASGKLLLAMTYQSPQPIDGRSIFCCYYFSDDQGKTWWKSNTDSWTIPGNETMTFFGENKLIECEDGSIRMYTTWQPYGYMVYSESTDGGKTFGPINVMYNMYTPQGSFGLVRDPYADNDHTYYLVWLNRKQVTTDPAGGRTRLSLAKTTDGKNFEFICDIMRWEATIQQGVGFPNHVVDPFISVTKDYIYAGTGFSDGMQTPNEGGYSYHFAQRQHIFTIKKDTLPEGKLLNKFYDVPLASNLYDAVTNVSESGILSGTTETTFAPAENISGTALKGALDRLAKADTSAIAADFADSETVTVQQICTALAKLANYASAENGTGKTAASFPDGALASKEIEWAVANGVYEGISGKLESGAPATRGVAAIMLSNYINTFAK